MKYKIYIYVQHFQVSKLTLYIIDFFPIPTTGGVEDFIIFINIYNIHYAHNIMIACSAGKYRKIIKDIDDYDTTTR